MCGQRFGQEPPQQEDSRPGLPRPLSQKEPHSYGYHHRSPSLTVCRAVFRQRIPCGSLPVLCWFPKLRKAEVLPNTLPVHDLYFEPKYEEFGSRTIWSLSNAFASAFKELDPVPQFKATATLGEFLDVRFSQSF